MSPKLSSVKQWETHGCMISTVATDSLGLQHLAINSNNADFPFLYPCPTKLVAGILESPCPSVSLSIRRRHVFQSVTPVCFGISIFMCMLFVAMGRSLLIFSNVISKWPPGGHIGIFGFWTLTSVWFWISTPNISSTYPMCMGRSLLIFSDVTFKMATWRPYYIFSCDQAALWMAQSVRPSVCLWWCGWGCEVSCGGHHRPIGKTTTGSALDGAVFDIAQILAYLVNNMSRSQLYLGFGHFGWLPSFFGQ